MVGKGMQKEKVNRHPLAAQEYDQWKNIKKSPIFIFK